VSIRADRKKELACLEQRIAKVRELQRADAAEEKALLVAHAALAEEPRALIHCDFVKHYATVSLAVERADCSECLTTVMGVEESWKFCPVCGSQVTSVTRENSPEDRLTRQAVKQAMEGVYA
jgi:formate dehydrogenase maturation protein FdhE